MTTSTAAGIEALAERFFAAVSAGDVETIASIYADDAVVWHNNDDVEMTKEQNVAQLAFLHRELASMRYVDVRRVVVDDGFVQQHVLEIDDPTGLVRMPAMMRVYCDSERVHRIEEYVDPAPVVALFRRRRG